MLVLLLLAAGLQLSAQDAVQYQRPPRVMEELALAKPTPSISVDRKGEWMLIIERNSYPDVEELGQPEVRVAGMRINPANFSSSRQNYINNFTLKNIKTGQEFPISGLPANLLAGTVSWSPQDSHIAFTNHTSSQVDLYLLEVATKTARRINQSPLNMIMGGAFTWLDETTLLYKTIVKPASAMPVRPITPKGPTVQESYGRAAPRPTFQDMIKSPYDEQLFEFFALAQLVRNSGGVETPVGKPAIYASVQASPDRQYLLVRTIRKPYSYTVPASGFNSQVSIWNTDGAVVKELFNLPSSETAPAGYDNVQDAPRGIDWRDDEPATVVWCRPLDKGLLRNKADFRDAVYALQAPFTGTEQELFKTKDRYTRTIWGSSNFALVMEGLRSKATMAMFRVNPLTGEREELFARSTTDAYNNPGVPVLVRNAWGREVVQPLKNGAQLLMNNPSGSSPDGDLPFLALFDLKEKKSTLLWRCRPGSFELVTEVLDVNKLVVITRRESQTEVPNYWLKNLRAKIADRQLTAFANPYPQLEGVTKQKIRYKRADGVDLTGDLYLPKGYDPARDGRLPVLMWAYPREFTNAADAAQVRGSQHTFTRISWGSPIYWVTQGYAVLDNAEMPIVSTSPENKPNDDFVQQLKLNARAAIDYLYNMGVGDSTRMGVGGHSYGAFMTANLLAHTSWFKAGIARSGAYNRTLTPFSFQNEDRTYWQVPQLYFDMSPFSFAHQLKTPILLVHGDTDDNTGTYPIQSERMFAALKGNGGNVRYVSLPYEAHGYRGKENILHLLWEEHTWLEKYVKGKK